MKFEHVTTDGTNVRREVTEDEARKLLYDQYSHTEFMEGIRNGGCASVAGGMLRSVPSADVRHE